MTASTAPYPDSSFRSRLNPIVPAAPVRPDDDDLAADGYPLGCCRRLAIVLMGKVLKRRTMRLSTRTGG